MQQPIERSEKLLEKVNNMLSMDYTKVNGGKNMDIFIFIVVILAVIGVGLKKYKPETYERIKNNIKNIGKDPF